MSEITDTGSDDTIFMDSTPDVVDAETISEEDYQTNSSSMANLSTYFEGYINDQYGISGDISIENNVVTGRYYYNSTMRKYGDKPSTYIQLRGTCDDEGHMELTGTFHNGKTERWTGVFDGSDFEGTLIGEGDHYFDVRFSTDIGDI